MTSQSQKKVYGDFQTPAELAEKICACLKEKNIAPQAIIEPTCGVGQFLLSGLQTFLPRQAFGLEINEGYAKTAEHSLSSFQNVDIQRGDFFTFSWASLIQSLPSPFLILTNPPWSTNEAQTKHSGKNLPKKKNTNLQGIESLLGKSNFDISEPILQELAEWAAAGKSYVVAICKTSVARKLLVYFWSKKKYSFSSEIYEIDAKKWFRAAVDACVFYLDFSSTGASPSCQVYSSLEATRLKKEPWVWKEGLLLADPAAYERQKHLFAKETTYVWRSGVKHDCAPCLELRKTDTGLMNKQGKALQVEAHTVFPFLKSSDLLHARTTPSRYVLLPQKKLGEDTSLLQQTAPLAWAYLQENAAFFQKRKSSIYNNQPAFSLFGIGEYSFSPWKIAVSSFQKSISFHLVPSFEGQPVLFDDTVYFLSFSSEKEALFVFSLLSSSVARDGYSCLLLQGEKRCVTIERLKKMSLFLIAKELKRESEWSLFHPHFSSGENSRFSQMSLF